MKFRKLAMVASVLSLMHATGGQAQEKSKCVRADEAKAMVSYLLPHAVDAARSKCSTTLSAEAALLQENSEQLAKYRAASENAWPDAKMAFQVMAGDKFPMDLDDAALKPFAGVLIAGMIQSEIKAKDCGLIDRIYTDLEPMPSANLASLVVNILIETMKNDKDTKLPICEALVE